MPKHTETPPAAPPAAPPAGAIALGTVAQSGPRSLAALARLHSRACMDALKFNAELLDFTRRRIGAGFDASSRLRRCQTATEAADVMTDFCQGAIQDYAEESSTLLRIGAEMASQTSEEAVAEAARIRAGAI